jgi:hypothetical protein
VLDIARFWRVPPHLLGLMDAGSSYSSIEQQNMSFYQQTILPWLVKLEQELNLKGFLERERPELEVKFNADAILRTTTTERYTAYMTGRQAGFLSVNDIRRREGLPPVDGGDVLLQPLNMTPVVQPPAALPPASPPPPGGGNSTAVRSLIEDAARRVLTKEAKALTRAAKKHQGQELQTWAERFYESHEELVARVFTAPLRAAGLTTDPTEYAKAHCAASVRAVTAGIDAGADALDLADEWTDIRPVEIVDLVISQEARQHAA